MKFRDIFSAIIYISDQVTRSTVLPLRVPDQRNSMHKHPEDMQAQSHTVSTKSGNSGAVGKWGGEDFRCQLLGLEFTSQQPYKKTPFYKEQLAATCILRKLLSYQITQCFIYVMCHRCKKTWHLSSFALLEFYAELLTPAKHSLRHCFKWKVMKEALRLHNNFLCTGVCVNSARTLC